MCTVPHACTRLVDPTIISSESGEGSTSGSEDDARRASRPNDNGKVVATCSSQQSQPESEERSSRSSSPILAPPHSPLSHRSRSPVVKALMNQPMSSNGRIPSLNVQARSKFHVVPSRYILPSTFCIALPLPWGRHVRKISGDFRKAGENIILLLSMLYGIRRTFNDFTPNDHWILVGKYMILYFEAFITASSRAWRGRVSLSNLSHLDTSFVFLSSKNPSCI